MRLEQLLQAYALLPDGRVLLVRRAAALGWRLVFASPGLAVPDHVQDADERPPAEWGGAVVANWRPLMADGLELWLGQVAAGFGGEASELIASLGHELRTPLNGLLGTLGVFAREALTPAQADMVALMQRSGAGLERLLTDLLDFSRLQQGAFPLHLQPFDPAEEIAAAARLFEPMARAKGLAFHLELEFEDGVRLLGDSLRLRQLVSNLVSNAVKFTERGEVLVAASIRGDHLDIRVEDTGCGLPSEFADRLFSRYAQSAEGLRRGGAGLGLSICRALAQRLGGTLTAVSAAGEGSCFTLRLPAEFAAPMARQDDPPPLALEGLRVLAADDHPVNRRVLELILAPLGVRLALAATGEEVLDLFQAMQFDCVLLDWRMPGLDGAATLARIRGLEQRRSLAPTPVALLSADPRARALPADGFIPKPITTQGLLEGLAELLRPQPATQIAGAVVR